MIVSYFPDTIMVCLLHFLSSSGQPNKMDFITCFTDEEIGLEKVSDHAKSHSWKGAKPGLEARSVWVYSTYSFTSPIAILRIVEWKFWLFWVFMVLRGPNEVNPSWRQPLVLSFLFLLLGGTDSRVSGSVACHYPLQWHNVPTLVGKTILHDNGLQSVHCEILALNFSPEKVMGSHLSR